MANTHIIFILDRSSSMDTIKSQVISGFNEYVESQKRAPKEEGEQVLMSLTEFDDNVHVKYVNKPIDEVEPLTAETYVPNGMTALYDAVGQTIREVEQRHSSAGRLGAMQGASPDNQDAFLVVIQTDGDDNRSREFNQGTMLADLITEKQNAGNWTFVFLGADQDAWAKSQRLGILRGNTLSYASGDHRDTMDLISEQTVAYRADMANTRRRIASGETDAVLRSTSFFTGNDQSPIPEALHPDEVDSALD